MTASNWLQVVSILLGILLFMIPIIYFAGKLVGKFETVITRLAALENKITNFQKDCFTKTEADQRILDTDKIRESQWKAIDNLRKIVMKVCFKIGINPEDEK